MPQQSNWLDQYLVRESADAPPASGGSFASPAAAAPSASWLDQFAVPAPSSQVQVPSSFATVNGQPVGGDEEDDDPTWMDSATKFFSEALTAVKPSTWMKAADAINPLYVHPDTGNWMPYETLRGILNSPGPLAKKAKDAFEKGDTAQGVRHAINFMIPILGPRLDEAGDLMAAGETARGLGATVDVAGQLMGPQAAANMARGIRLPGIIKNPNAADAAAVQAGLDAGVPVDAATASGSPYVRGVQNLSTHTTLSGAHTGQQAVAAQAAGLTQWGETLANRVAPGPARTIEQAGESLRTSIAARAARDAASRTRAGERLAGKVSPAQVSAEQAGQGVRDALGTRINTLHQEANTAYEALRAIEADPANAAQVNVKVPMETRGGGTFFLDQVETVPLPVNMAPVKAALAPLRDRLLQTMPLAQRQASPGLLALDNIINGPDNVPLSVADAGLSAIKRIAREASSPDLRNVSQGVAAKAVSDLDAAVQRAAAKAGPAATKALTEGRAATKAKYAAAEVLEALATEPVKAAGQLTRPRDTALRQLQEVQRLAPDQMPVLGRSYIDGLLEADPGVASRQWAQLGPRSKDLLIADPKTRQALDTYFRPGPGAKGSAAEVLAALPDEPVRILTQATYAKDAGIGKLRALARLAPEQMPVVGRALLDDMLDKATAKGGFDGAAGLKKQWDQIGTETKHVLFKNPAHIRELDHFFTLANRMNPSLGSPTAYVLGVASHAWHLANPVTFAAQEISGATVARLLHSPAGVRALTRGLTVKVGDKAAAATAYANLARMAGGAAERPAFLPSHAPAIPAPATDEPARTQSQRGRP